MTRKQFIVAISLVLVLVAGAIAAFLVFTAGPPEENSVVGTEDLTASELADIEIISSTFLQEASNFGVNMDTLTEETVSQRMQDIADDNGGTSWVKREAVAARLANEYIDLSGGFSFEPDSIANADYVDGNSVANFRAGSMDLSADSTADYVYTSRDEPTLIATVEFSGTSTLSHFSQSPSAQGDELENHDVDSTPWDISEQTVPLEGTLSLSRDQGSDDWRIRELRLTEGEFALPFWAPEEFTTSYPGTTLGGTVVRSVDFPSTQEDVDVPE